MAPHCPCGRICPGLSSDQNLRWLPTALVGKSKLQSGHQPWPSTHCNMLGTHTAPLILTTTPRWRYFTDETVRPREVKNLLRVTLLVWTKARVHACKPYTKPQLQSRAITLARLTLQPTQLLPIVWRGRMSSAMVSDTPHPSFLDKHPSSQN